MNKWDIIFMITFPLWIISLVVGLQLSEHGGLLINIACTVVTLLLLGINAVSWFKLTNVNVKEVGLRSAIEDSVDKKFKELKKGL